MTEGRASIAIRRWAAVAGSITVVLGTLTAQAVPAAAAPGDIASALTLPGTIETNADIVVGPDGNLWTTSYYDRSISAISPSGALIGTFPLTGTPTAVATMVNGVWVAYQDRAYVSRVNSSGAIDLNCPTAGVGASDIAVGPDGLYYSDLGSGNVVRSVIRRGSIWGCFENVINTSGLSANRISAGPEGSSKLYVQYRSNNYGIVLPPDRVRNHVIPSMAVMDFVQTVGQEAWFLARNTGGEPRLVRLINDNTLAESPAWGVEYITPALGSGAWLLDRRGRSATLVDGSATAQASYALPQGPLAAVIGPDGNLWIRTTNSVLRMLTGQVPTVRTAPRLDPTRGVGVGTRVTSDYAEWNFLPRAFAFQWQGCTANDPVTCTDIPGATRQSYVATAAEAFLRVGVSAYNDNGLSVPAYSALVPVGAGASGSGAGSGSGSGSAPAGAAAAVGAGVVASLSGPSTLRRSGTGAYQVSFSAPTATGQVTFTFTRGARTFTVPNVPVAGGRAVTNWRVARTWPRGAATIRANFTPAPGSGLVPGSMLIRTMIS